MTFRTILVAAFAAVMVSSQTPSAAQCLGDFNGDFNVSVDELVIAVQNSLDECEFNGPRFTDNHDGTVTDHKTALVWEKKDNLDGNADPSDLHDADNTFSWSASGTAPDGTAFMAFLFGLNGGTSADGLTTSGCFTGHCDWRLPTIEELTGLVDPTQGGCAGDSGACIDPTVGPTQADGYWSATTFTHTPTTAWLLDLSGGDSAHGGKAIAFFVRAVRGGL